MLKATFRCGLVLAAILVCARHAEGQAVFDNQCPVGQFSIVPLRTVVTTTGHFNDTVCYDTNGNLVFQSLNASLAASDTFTRANGGLGSNWNSGIVAPQITSNAAGGSNGQYEIAAWNNPAFVSNSQFSQASIVIIGAGESGPAVFVSSNLSPASSGVGYFCGEGTTSITLYRTLGSGVTSLGTSAITGANGDVLRLEITSAGALTCFRNGVSTLAASDTTYKNGSPGLVFRGSGGTPSTLSNWTGGNLPVSSGKANSWIGGTGLITNTGIFNGNNNNDYLQSVVNNCNPATEIQTIIGALGSLNAVTGCSAVPASATINLSNGVAGYVTNSSPFTTAEGVFGQGRAIVSNANNTEALNGIITDAVGVTGTTLEGLELDVNVLGTPTTVRGITVVGASTGTMPATSAGINVSAPGVGKLWGTAYATGVAASNVALGVGSTSAAPSSASQQIQLNSVNSGGTTITAIIQSDGAGQINLTPVSPQNVGISGALGNTARTATMGLTLKKGTGAGNYTTASTTYVVTDSTNLCFTVLIPTGWKLSIATSGAIGTATGAVNASLALTDNAACSTANSGILVETTETTTAAGVLQPISLNWVVAGDGATHNVALQYKTSNAADSATLLNASATQLPTIVYTLMPSN